jgi:hypothetical protein
MDKQGEIVARANAFKLATSKEDSRQASLARLKASLIAQFVEQRG